MDLKNTNLNCVLEKLSKSKFRSSFHLKKNDLKYIDKIGLIKIKEHAFDFIRKRLAPEFLKNDGKQTPTKGHPVFIAQHATATCCRGCLYKWHHIAKNKELTTEEINFIVNLIMKWIEKEYKNVDNT